MLFIIIINKNIYASGSPLMAFWRMWNSFLTHLSSFIWGFWVSWNKWEDNIKIGFIE
jgi:hypothetical protein